MVHSVAQGESVDEGDLPVGATCATFGTSNVEGYEDSDEDDFEDEEPDEVRLSLFFTVFHCFSLFFTVFHCFSIVFQGALASLNAELSALKMVGFSLFFTVFHFSPLFFIDFR